jgi:hypothetical protein
VRLLQQLDDDEAQQLATMLACRLQERMGT